MKLLKRLMVWALVVLVYAVQNTSAGHFIVLSKKSVFSRDLQILPYDHNLHFCDYKNVKSPLENQVAFHPVYGDFMVYRAGEWEFDDSAFIVDISDVETVDDLKKRVYEKKPLYRFAIMHSWAGIFTDEFLVDIGATRNTFIEKRIDVVNSLIEKGLSVDTKNKVIFLVRQMKALHETARTEKIRENLVLFESKINAVDIPTPDASKPAAGDNTQARDEDKKTETKPNGLQVRFMSINAGYRYAGANVAMLVLASILQVMQDGYCGAEAKDIAQLSMKKKAVRALAAVVSLKKHASNVSALYRVVRPVSEKGVVSPKFLARATQFAKNKPFIVAGLLGVTALNTYGVYSHAGDIKTYAGEMGAKAKGLVTKKTA